MKIINLKTDQLIPYINNPRDNVEAVDKVASSIKDFGFNVPIVIDKDNVVINGHTRLLASKKLGLEEVPCIVADDLTEAQIKAFRIADNKVSEYSKWNEDLLKIELECLNELDFNMNDFGFINVDITEDLVIPNFDFDDDEADYDDEKDNESYTENTNYEDTTEYKSEGIIQYNIIFNNKDEQLVWQDFLRYIKANYEGETISEKLVKHIKEIMLDERH